MAKNYNENFSVLPVHMIRTGGCVYRLRGRRLTRVKKSAPSDELKELKDIDLEVGEDEKKLPGEVNSTADIASNIALASFCSNSMNSAIDSNT